MTGQTVSAPPCEVSWFSALCDDDYEFLGVPDAGLRSSFEHCRNIALVAETGGFDNLLLPSGYALGIDSIAFASGMAPLLKRMRLLAAIRCGEMWPPQLARQLATLDRMLGGRLTVNIISSELPGEMLASAPRYGRTVEVMKLLGALMNGEAVDHQGRVLQAEAGSAAHPVAVGPASALLFRRALGGCARSGCGGGRRLSDVAGSDRDRSRDRFGPLARAARRGRKLKFGYRVHVVVRESEAEARLAADRLLSKLDDTEGARIRAGHSTARPMA